MGQHATVAEACHPLIRAMLGPAPAIGFEFWDGSTIRPEGDFPGTLRVLSRDALRHLVWAPGELGFGRAYVSGSVDLDGDIFETVRALRSTAPRSTDITPASVRRALATTRDAVGAARELGALGRRPPVPPEEARPRRGRLHTRGRDAAAISHHYDVGNDFYRLVLGPSMTYSCGRFAAPGDLDRHGANPAVDLTGAQAAKHDLICRKLGLGERSGMRLLDVGCGWGSMAMHAASVYGARVVGVTISRAQAELARKRVAEAGLSDSVEIRLSDYRELRGERFDAISSIGMFEHVGTKRTAEYFDTLRALLDPRGRLLNHAISAAGGSVIGGRSFVGRYVFPDGELIDVGRVVLAMERAGFEVRDVESLREHYALTLRRWVANLEENWDRAVSLAGAGRARVWRLYMAASAVGFQDGELGLHQVLGVVPGERGDADLPGTRRPWF
ncbi:cyclopropane-fatty-acyl-phospholipid synthase family protein [Nocardia sp. NEAU-G5]|uniref:Cyclopropane-fatty-acyl-phospholipid synthase family protein n=1 Tax=Nocardia albiluteola TaxID=2842303 RepID=A0ABS6B258_9NOCA|nr:cyclopropane-fatty-acyl-phospholipid synthase family protein [Nocardia albiluteola]MBU3064386.1 cyclopropane-fatty-acyl-phospholipid synthase family protein [Nocardia albiluteola]